MENTLNYKFTNKLYRWIGWGAMLVLLLLAAVFYMERSLMWDVPFQTFYLINEGTFQVQVYRYGVVLVQFLPLLAIKLGASIQGILFTYSLSFALLHLAAYAIIVKILKNEYLGLCLVLLFTMLYQGAFYWTISEYQQALSVLLVYFAILLRYPKVQHKGLLGLLIFLTISLVFYHPLIFIIYSFLWMFFFLKYEQLRNFSYLFLYGIMWASVVIKSRFFKNWYDKSKYDSLWENVNHYYPNYLNIESNQQFWEHTQEMYFVFPILLASLLGFYVIKKAYLKSLLIVGFSLAYLFLVNIGHPKNAEDFYMESFYFPMALFVVIPLVFDVLPQFKSQKWILPAIGIFIALRLAAIANEHQYFEERLGKVNAIIEKANEQTGQKFKIEESQLGDLKTENTWALPFETLLLSSIQQADNQKTIFAYTHINERQKEQIHKTDVFLYMDKFFKNEDLNPKYFKIKTETYQDLKTIK